MPDVKHFYQRRRFTVWISGIWAAVVHGSAGAVGSFLALAAARGIGVDVPQFTLRQLGYVAGGAGLSALCAFLRDSPLPKAEDDTNAWLEELRKKENPK